MSALLFLGGALVLFLLVAFVSWLRHRERAVRFDSSIDDFQDRMGMLAPNRDKQRRRRR